jgi:hypothetical protein
MVIAPVSGVLRVPAPLLGDPDTPRETELAVHHENLPVGPVVEPTQGVHCTLWKKATTHPASRICSTSFSDMRREPT